jgi:hypothetical protein
MAFGCMIILYFIQGSDKSDRNLKFEKIMLFVVPEADHGLRFTRINGCKRLGSVISVIREISHEGGMAVAVL